MGRGGVIEGIEEIWDRLKLSEEENRPTEMNCSQLETIQKRGERTIVEKFCLDQTIVREIVRMTMEKI